MESVDDVIQSRHPFPVKVTELCYVTCDPIPAKEYVAKCQLPLCWPRFFLFLAESKTSPKCVQIQGGKFK